MKKSIIIIVLLFVFSLIFYKLDLYGFIFSHEEYITEKNIPTSISNHFKKVDNTNHVDISIEKYEDVNDKRIIVFSYNNAQSSKTRYGYAVYKINWLLGKFRFNNLGYTSYNFSKETVMTYNRWGNKMPVIAIYGHNPNLEASYFTINVEDAISKINISAEDVFIKIINIPSGQEIKANELRFYNKSDVDITSKFYVDIP